MSPEIEKVCVVIPAHNEESLIGGCLEALHVALGRVSVPVRVVVVLDDCTDRSREISSMLGFDTIRIAARNVGQARATGFRTLLDHELAPHSVWLASTDADTRVHATWVQDQIELANSGTDLVLGLVRVADDGSPPTLRRDFEAAYTSCLRAEGRAPGHDHVHGANLGVRASAYIRAGGFPHVANHEDRQLVQRLQLMHDVSVTSAQHIEVDTSGRLEGRCQHGFASSLASMNSRTKRLVEMGAG
jgi:glycosyltransferase involved in cell wall biosynthesis